MKKGNKTVATPSDRDTMRPEYDFSAAVRGLTAQRYAQGANIVVIDPDVIDVFPDGVAVNDALRALAPLIRERPQDRKPRLTKALHATRGKDARA